MGDATLRSPRRGPRAVVDAEHTTLLKGHDRSWNSCEKFRGAAVGGMYSGRNSGPVVSLVPHGPMHAMKTHTYIIREDPCIRL